MSKFNYISIDSTTKGNVLANNHLNRYFINRGYRRNTELMQYITKTSDGSIVFTIGEGRYNLLLVGGVHGNELASQAALINLMNDIVLDNIKLKCRLHIIPFLIPYTTMANMRKYNDKDMNRYANSEGITKKIVDYAVKNNITALCDCHSTNHTNFPGFKSVFCSVNPMPDSYKIARHICLQTDSKLIPLAQAGSAIRGAVEDESNLRGVPAITCETLCENGIVEEEAVDFSYEQIKSFLNYFGVI